MILDSSALVSLIRAEPGFEVLEDKIDRAGIMLKIGAPNLLEASIVIDGRRDPIASRALDRLLDIAGIVSVPFTHEHWRIAREAYRDFGRGNGHPAKLNFGDCMAYATAKIAGEPLLFIGDDFPHTDIEAA